MSDRTVNRQTLLRRALAAGLALYIPVKDAERAAAAVRIPDRPKPKPYVAPRPTQRRIVEWWYEGTEQRKTLLPPAKVEVWAHDGPKRLHIATHFVPRHSGIYVQFPLGREHVAGDRISFGVTTTDSPTTEWATFRSTIGPQMTQMHAGWVGVLVA